MAVGPRRKESILGRPPSPFNALQLRRNLKKYNLSDKRQLVRKFLFGENAHKYKTGNHGEPFNEFELDQIIVFFAIANYDNFTPSTFHRSKNPRSESYMAQHQATSNLHPEPGPGDQQDGSSPLDNPDDLDRLFSNLGD